MTDDRASLGARMAEAMGWTWYDNRKLWRAYDDHSWTSEELTTWPGYGVVDAWMREQGWKKTVMWLGQNVVLVEYWYSYGPPGQHMDTDADEPLAAIQAALAALEARE